MQVHFNLRTYQRERWQTAALLWFSDLGSLFMSSLCFALISTACPRLARGAIAAVGAASAGVALHQRHRLRQLELIQGIVDQAEVSGFQQQAMEHFTSEDVWKLATVDATIEPELVPMREWYPHFREWPTILVFGGQGSGKTTFAQRLMHDRAQAGHQIEVLDPHAALDQWAPFQCLGAGMDYRTIDRAMLQFRDEVKQFYKLRSQQRNVTAQAKTVVCDELTQWADRCEESGDFFKASLCDLRKANRGVIYIAHDRTLTALGGGKGVAAARDAQLLELELEAEIGPNGKPVPAMRGKLYLPGKKSQPIPVALDQWQPPIVSIQYEGHDAIAPANNQPQLADPWEEPRALPSGGDAPSHPLDRLLELEAKPAPVAVGELPEHLAKLCELSQQLGWVTARICKQKSRTFKDISSNEIRSYFEELLTRGVGATRGQGPTMEWCLQPSA